MSGQKYAQAGKGENTLVALGNQQTERGNQIARPNMLQFAEASSISASDKANTTGLAKARDAAAGADAAMGVNGLRAGMGANSAAVQLANTGLAEQTGQAMTADQVGTQGNLRTADLQAKTGVADMALKGESAALTGLRAGAAAQGQAGIQRTQNYNEAWKDNQNMLTNVAMLGLKGLKYGGTKFGMNVGDAMTDTALTAKSGFWGGVGKAFGVDQTAANGLWNDKWSTPGTKGFGGFTLNTPGR